jgi:hypothetical protein
MNSRLLEITLALAQAGSRAPLPAAPPVPVGPDMSATPPRKEFSMTPAHQKAMEAANSGKSIIIHGGPGLSSYPTHHRSYIS